LTPPRRLGEQPRLNAALLSERFADSPPVTRFAPSVTGTLHLGHLVNACWTWGLARANGGRVLLRLEDHDRGRYRGAHQTAILDELDWLGFIADEPSTDEFREGASAFRQSDHPERYEAALATLRSAGLVYACDCSRRDIAGRRETPAEGELRYDGFCRERGLSEGPDSRLRVRLPEDDVRFDDLFAGPQEQRPTEQCGDLLVRDGEGSWTYQACVAIDDFEEGVSLVVRGADLLDSTGRQVLFARALGRETEPLFAHHALIGDAHGRKLSKTDNDACVITWRKAGRRPQEMLGHAAWLAGLREEDAPMEIGQLGELVTALIGRS
jgi:glutamyl-Q tRNA(Asp) synthetase